MPVFLADGVLECNLAHRRSVVVLCMLFKIKSNPMHPLRGALPVLHVPARVTRGALVAHRRSFAVPRCRTFQYRRTFVPHSVSLWNDISDAMFDGVGLAGLKSRANSYLLENLFFLYVFNSLSLFLPPMGWLCGVGVLGLIE